MKERLFTLEADLVAAFCTCIDPAKWANNPDHAPKWIQYHETSGWDLLLVHPNTGEQIGIEAKLSLNAKVLAQALPSRWTDYDGPDFRAVLVPADGLQGHMEDLAHHLGIIVLRVTGRRGHAVVDGQWKIDAGPMAYDFRPDLPQGDHAYRDWPNWCPIKRCELPEYVPDVAGGKPSPQTLSPWKIKAIKLLILLDRFGAVSRRDMQALGISPTLWTQVRHGYLDRGPDGYIRSPRTPDLKTQHPVNWTQIEADFEKWGSKLCAGRVTVQRLGLESAA